jgi:hypothetical protein
MAKNSISNNKKAGGGNKVGNNKKAGGGNSIGNNRPVSPAPGQATPTPPPEIWNPGEENAHIEPFLTQQDIEEYAEAREQYEEGLKELDRNYETTKHNNEYEEAEIEVGRKQGKESANWDFAGRGLFHSSVRDLDLSDIDATAEIKKKFLSDQLSALAVCNEGQKKSMEAKWNRYNEAVERKKVENAAEVNSTMPRWKVEPHWETQPITQSKPKSEPAKKAPFKANEPIGFNPGHQTSKNGGITAPPPNPSVSPNQKARNASHVAVATNKIAGKLYG